MDEPSELKIRFHIAEFIKDEIDERGWSLEQFAIRMHWKEIGVTILALELLMGCPEVALDEEMAGRMAGALGVSKEFLMNLDRACRID